MGLSSKKSTVKTTENTAQQATVTPQNPEWVTGALSDYTDRIGAFGNMDPNSFVAPASPLQQRAFSAAGNMGGWQGQTALASQMAGRAARAPANLGGQASTYAAPQMGQARTVQATGYGAPDLGQAQGYAAARVGAPIGASAQGYQSTGAANETIQPIREAASQTGAQNTQNYFNPFTRDVVNTSLADFDRDAGAVRAQQAAEAARNGAFSGSRYGIREAETEGELSRARGAMDANLRSAAFDKSVGFGMQDADRATQASMFNAGASNSRDLAQADMNSRTSMFNAQSADQASQFGFDAINRATMFNADAGNRAVLAQVGMDNDANRYAADMGNQFKLAQGGMDAQAGQFNAAQGQQAGMFNAGAQNDFAGQQAGLNAQAGQFNAGQQQQMSMFNAGQRDNQAGRMMQGAGLMGDLANSYAGNVRGDLALMGDMGAQQRGIEQQYALSPLAQLQSMGQLYGATPFDLFKGQNTSGTVNSSGTNVTKSTPSLFDMYLASAQVAASASASERRVKRDIERIGEHEGLGLYRYNYVWDAADEPKRTGVMVDEVEKIAPHALGPVIAGIQTVNYETLGLAHLVERRAA